MIPPEWFCRVSLKQENLGSMHLFFVPFTLFYWRERSVLFLLAFPSGMDFFPKLHLHCYHPWFNVIKIVSLFQETLSYPQLWFLLKFMCFYFYLEVFNKHRVDTSVYYKVRTLFSVGKWSCYSHLLDNLFSTFWSHLCFTYAWIYFWSSLLFYWFFFSLFFGVNTTMFLFIIVLKKVLISVSLVPIPCYLVTLVTFLSTWIFDHFVKSCEKSCWDLVRILLHLVMDKEDWPTIYFQWVAS